MKVDKNTEGLFMANSTRMVVSKQEKKAAKIYRTIENLEREVKKAEIGTIEIFRKRVEQTKAKKYLDVIGIFLAK